MGAGGLMIATLSGYDIDLQLIAIIVLGALGAWLLLSAAVSGLGRKKQVAQATAPVVEEPASADRATAKAEAATPAAAPTTVAEKPAGAQAFADKAPGTKSGEDTDSLKPDAVTKRPARTTTPAKSTKSAKPTTKKPANKQSRDKKPTDKEPADGQSADPTSPAPTTPQD